MKPFLLIISTALVVGLAGCKQSTTSINKSSVAQLTAFYFAADKRYPGLDAATFKVEERLDTGWIYNPDSIMFGTPLDSVVPKFTFAATPGSALLRTPDSTIVLSGSDTIDFTRQPIYLDITSADGTNTKVYEIRTTVHQIDPDVVQWEQLTPQIYPADNSEQRVVMLQDRFVLVKNNGFSNSVYTSQDGQEWNDEGVPSGLPSDCHVRGILSDNTTLYYVDSVHLYTSTDAMTWQSTDYSGKGITLGSMLMVWNDTVWAVVKQDGALVLAKMQDGELRPTEIRPKGDFPISDFAAVCFENASMRSRAMILGGYAEGGKALNARWNLEYSTTIHTLGGYRIQNFSIDRPTFRNMTGVSVVWYDKSLYMFGGVDADMQYVGRDILISTDEGLTWHAADSTKNYIPQPYSARQKQSVVVRDNYIYVIGGESRTETYSDVYRGKLNSIDW
ncbi:MAG: DUF6242 domain-containing protein [Paludibacteraceae bacterium]